MTQFSCKIKTLLLDLSEVVQPTQNEIYRPDIRQKETKNDEDTSKKSFESIRLVCNKNIYFFTVK